MAADATFDPARILEALHRHEVRFVLIGGLAAEVHGCGWSTLDLDIVVAATRANFEALEAALRELGATYNDPAGRHIEPTVERMASLRGPQLFRTAAGRLDVLRDAGTDTFETLEREAMETGDGTLVASLESLQRMKRAAGRPKDRVGLERIEALLRTRK